METTINTPAASKAHVDLPALIDLLHGQLDSQSSLLDLKFRVQRLESDEVLTHEGADARAIYIVQSGSFKCVKTVQNGDEYVLNFVWPRDVMGYDGLYDGRYGLTAVALEDSRVVVLPMQSFLMLRRESLGFDIAFQRTVSAKLRAIGEHAEVMAAASAEVRLARLFHQISSRLHDRGLNGSDLQLHMSRRDIANHMGVTHETVSRSLRVLVELGLLAVRRRHVTIHDRTRLHDFAYSGRSLHHKPVDPDLRDAQDSRWDSLE